jgi:hypothetical protein
MDRLRLRAEHCGLGGFHGKECAPCGRTKTASKLAAAKTIWAGCRALQIQRRTGCKIGLE